MTELKTTVPNKGEDESSNTVKVDKLARMPDSALREFIIDYVDGRIFSSNMMVDEKMLPNVFMPIMFCMFEDDALNQLGLVWEHRSQALASTAINGMPIFASCRLMHKEDWKLAIEKIHKLIDMRKTERETLDLGGKEE